MTIGTGKRASQACLRCRRRKTKCSLGVVGDQRKPPCVTCLDTGSDCVLVNSRRGKTRPHRRSRAATNATSTDTGTNTPPQDVGLSLPANGHGPESDNWSTIDEDECRRQSADENLHMELRNPSDALEILARSDNVPTEDPVSGPESIHNTPSNHSITKSFPSTNNIDITNQLSRTPSQSRQAAMVLDDYQLIQQGLLHPSELPELLLIFAQNYHPYFPVTPSYFLEPLAMERIAKSDYFLLTIILTIASRDSPHHSLTHRYCWDHTQRLLLEVLLAQPWAQTTRTVEGLLLLAEWLPHIQIKQTTLDAPQSLFSEDRTAWSLVGLAVRQGYLLRLDRAAFRTPVENESKDREEHKRLVWAFVYMADRQISVRLGQSFWSRGPSLSSHFTAKDFPSLKPVAGAKDEDYASVLHSSLELTQILYNAHLILYSSTERTLAMISDGDYARYLDDFVRAVTTWHTTWKDIQVSHKVKSTLFMMYEYICLYVNAFSFQAVITRASTTQGTRQAGKRPLAEIFSRGVMSSPDGKYIFDAIGAAMNLVKLMNNLDPRHVLRYLPSRYYLYGVYAAVFLHKAQRVGAFQSLPRRREVTSLALRFVTVMADTPCTESHICHRYSRMLRNLCQRRDTHSDTSRKGPREDQLGRAGQTREPSLPQPSSSHQVDNRNNPTENFGHLENMEPEILGNGQELESEVMDFPSIEGYLFGSFLPGITDFGQGQLEGDLSEQDSWTEGLAGMDFGLHGTI